RSTVAAFVFIADDPCMTDCDEGEEALSSTKYATELVEGVVLVPPLEGPENPRMERVVASAIRDVGDAGQELSVECDAGSLDAEVIQTSDGLGWTYPRDTLDG